MRVFEYLQLFLHVSLGGEGVHCVAEAVHMYAPSDEEGDGGCNSSAYENRCIQIGGQVEPEEFDYSDHSSHHGEEAEGIAP